MTRSLISAGSAVSDTPRAQKDGSVPTPSHTRLTGAPRQAARTPRARPRLAAPEVAWHGPLKGHSARPSRDQCAGSGVPEAGASEVASPEAFVSSTSFPGYRLPSISCGRHRGCTARMPIRGFCLGSRDLCPPPATSTVAGEHLGSSPTWVTVRPRASQLRGLSLPQNRGQARERHGFPGRQKPSPSQPQDQQSVRPDIRCKALAFSLPRALAVNTPLLHFP